MTPLLATRSLSYDDPTGAVRRRSASENFISGEQVDGICSLYVTAPEEHVTVIRSLVVAESAETRLKITVPAATADPVTLTWTTLATPIPVGLDKPGLGNESRP